MPQEPATRLIRCEGDVTTRARGGLALHRLSLPRAPLIASFKSSVGRLADRLLTGWSPVRIRPGEPNKRKDLAPIVHTRNQFKIALWQHLWQQLTDFAQ